MSIDWSLQENKPNGHLSTLAMASNVQIQNKLKYTLRLEVFV